MRQAAASAVAFAVAAMIVIGGYFVTQQGAGSSVGNPTVTTTTTVSSSSYSSQTSTTYISSGSVTAVSNSSDGLELQLGLVFYRSTATNGSLAVSLVVDERNTLSTSNNMSKSSDWPVSGLEVGPCPNESVVPFGVALYQGYYTSANVTQGQPLEIYPVVPCPMYIRLVTGYLFQPSSDYALVLPGSGNATQMLSEVNVTGTYAGNLAMNDPTPLPPGTYTAVAGDEWGALVIQQFTISSDGTATLLG